MSRLLLALVPLAIGVAIAGIVSSPSKVRPCAKTYSKGFTGGVSHVDLGRDGALWATEGRNDKIARFDTQKQVATEFDLPNGTEPHDLAVGPGQDLWFSAFNGGLGRFDPETKKVEFIRRPSRGAQPHVWWADDGRGYFGDVTTGKLTTFDPETERFTPMSYNLPANSGIHGFVELPDGTTWWTLQGSDQLAHFDRKGGRFDQFVDLPKGSGPHWLVLDPSQEVIWVALLYANELARTT